MQELEAIEVTISGITAAFRVPLAATGVIPSVPVPTYPHLLGFVACCMGTYYPPAKIRFGFEFNVSGTGHDLEKIWRWDFKQGKPKRDDVTAIRKKEFLLDPELKLYVINDLQGIDLEKVFKCPVGVPTLGQSQDVVMITDVKKIKMVKKESGAIGATLLPFDYTMNPMPLGRIFTLPTSYEYPKQKGGLRVPKNIRSFIATSNKNGRQTVKLHNLYQPKNISENEKDMVIYIQDIE